MGTAEKKNFFIYDFKYEVGTGIGCWLKSHEKGVKQGDVRYLAHRLMHAWMIIYRGPWRPYEIWWTPIDDTKNDYEELRKWRDSL